MLFMNEWDIADTKQRVSQVRTPQLYEAVCILERLQQWTNANSDGWAYWPKPVRAAKALMTLIQAVDRFNPQDVTPQAVRKSCQPIRVFLTRQGVDPQVIVESVPA